MYYILIYLKPIEGGFGFRKATEKRKGKKENYNNSDISNPQKFFDIQGKKVWIKNCEFEVVVRNPFEIQFSNGGRIPLIPYFADKFNNDCAEYLQILPTENDFTKFIYCIKGVSDNKKLYNERSKL